MEKLGIDLDDGSSLVDAKQINPQEVRKLSIQRCIQLLMHACQCRDANCHFPNCQKMRRVIMHTKNCKRKTNGGCPICKQLIALCCYHAKHCQKGKECLFPLCFDIQHQIALRRRGMAVMNTSPIKPAAAVQAGQQTSNVAMTTGVDMKPKKMRSRRASQPAYSISRKELYKRILNHITQKCTS